MQVEIKELGVKVCKFVSCAALRQGLRCGYDGRATVGDATRRSSGEMIMIMIMIDGCDSGLTVVLVVRRCNQRRPLWAAVC